MQNDGKKTSYLFEVLLDQEQLHQLVHIQQQLFIKFIRSCVKHYHKLPNKHLKTIYIFLTNYKQIMQTHSKLIKDITSVNITLHFALTFTHHLLTENNLSYAKDILKQTQNYLTIQKCDLVMLAICMNNLAILQQRNKKYRKSLATSFNGIYIMQEHLQYLKQSKNRKRMIEDAVIFVNLLLIAKRNISKILNIYEQDEINYKQLLNNINRLGFDFSSKYLGIDSIFTNRFQYNQSTINLPIYDQSSISLYIQQPSQNINQRQIKIAQQLKNIYNLIKDINLEPQVYYIKVRSDHQKSKQQSIQSEIKIEVLPIQPIEPQQPQRSVCYVRNIIIDQWSAELSILKINNLSFEKDYAYLGHLHFKINKMKQSKQQTITQQNLFKIINILNVYDVLPYEMDIKKLSSQEFIKLILLNYVSITSIGQLSVFSRAKTIITPFYLKFCGQRSIILVNHIRFRQFRIGICPLNSCQTIYLEIDFKHKQIFNYIKIKQMQQNIISKLCIKYNLQQNYQYQYSQYKTIEIINYQFINKIHKIIHQFQIYLIEEEENKISDITTVITFSEQYLYYHYTQYQQSIGQFHILKYRSNINHFQINIKNIFQTYSPSGLHYAKGNVYYSQAQFIKDFSIILKHSRKKLASLSEIILQKFNLKIYQQPLEEAQEDIFEQNAIMELPLTSKCYLRKFIKFENYEIPVTIEIVTINNEKPVGIRITAYEPIKGNNSGIFIYIIPQYWERPIPKQDLLKEQSINQGVKRSTEDYNFKRCYFLTNWMQQQGFKKIFNRLIISNRTLQIKGIQGRFIRLQQLLRE